METVTKPALRATDRLRQTLAALARLLDQTMNDIQALDSEFQQRIHQTAQETQAALEQQASERLKLAVEEAEQNTRALLTEELQARFDLQMAPIDADRKELTAETERLRQEVEQLKRAAAEWESERTQLLGASQRAVQAMEQSRDEHSRALAETDEAAAIALERQIATAVNRARSELSARFDTERAQLLAERNRAQQRLAEAASEHEQKLTDAVHSVRTDLKDGSERLLHELEQTKEMCAQLEAERNRLREENEEAHKLLTEAAATAAAQPKSGEKSSVTVEALQAEVTRIESWIKEISQIIEDRDTELSIVIRKNAERAELESYLRGLRFAMTR
jgi:DNA repair exonuclease SbcCD ATPase subunit